MIIVILKKILRNKVSCWTILVWIFGMVAAPLLVQAAQLSFVRDTISTSKAGTVANHTIQFTTNSTIPASGKIIITPEAGAFYIPAGLDFNDIDIAVNAVLKAVAITAGNGMGSALGATVAPGNSGNITFTLNDTDPISAGSIILIKIGTNATYGGTGIQQITNPDTIRSYKISIRTENSSSIVLDRGETRLAVIENVMVSTIKTAPPPPPTLPTPPAPSPVPSGRDSGGAILPPSIPAKTFSSADFNHDGIVNSVDFSIMLFFWKIKPPFSNPYVDINKDEQVNSVDFSILLYQWGRIRTTVL